MPIARARRRLPAFEELGVVRTRATVSVDGRILPSGTLGAIVIAHRDGVAFDVEFAAPVGTVVRFEVGDIEAA